MKMELWAEKLKALGHPVRLEILVRLLDGQYDLKEIMLKFNMSQPAVSQHLSILRRLGIIRCSKDGVSMCYEIMDGEVRELIEKIRR